MASINWNRILERPLPSLLHLASAAVNVGKYVLWRITALFSSKPLPSLRTAVGNIVYGCFSASDRYLLFDPRKVKHEATATVQTPRFTAYLIGSPLKSADIAILYCHGGGYAVGHPLQYRSMYRRWQKKGENKGLKLCFMALLYPLSEERAYPAQLETGMAAYHYLLQEGQLDSRRICIAGDSAGGNLVAAILMRIKTVRNTPQPGGAILLSPWLDLSLGMIEKHECLDRDTLVHPGFMRNHLVASFTGDRIPANDPRISPVLAEDFSGLPNHLVCYGDLEVMQDEIQLWIKQCTLAGVSTTVHVGERGLHVFSVGGLVADGRLVRRSDEAVIEFLIEQKQRI